MRTAVLLCVIAALLAMVFAQELLDSSVINQHGEESTRFFEERKFENMRLDAQLGSNVKLAGVYGVDYSTGLSTATLACIKGKLSSTAFAIPRGYRSSGSLDPNVITNVKNARAAGFQYVDTYLFPCPKCGTSGSSQVATLASKLKANGINYGMVWLDIEGTQYWGSQRDNVAFLNSMLSGCSANGVKCGIYSSKSQWTAIMGTSTAGASYPLWYPHYDKVPNFSDWVSFGGWSKPNIKQYIGDTTLCGAGVDLSVY